MAVAIEQRKRPDRGMGWFMSQQTAESRIGLALGIASLLVLFLGLTGVLTFHGWTPTESLTEGITSAEFLATALLAAGLALAGIVLGVARYRSMPTKPAREAIVAGGALGAQTLVVVLVILRFRAGDVDLVVRNFLDFQLLGEFWTQFVRGAWNTIVLSFAGGGIGLVLGIILSVFIMSKRAVVRAPARVYINFFRGTPLIWQLSFAGLGVVAALRIDFFSGIEGPYRVAIAVLALNTGAYSAEVFRAGIQSLERGQMEAARSLGMSYLQALRYVILPQAVRRVIPPLTNEFVILVKDTSLVIVLGLTLQQKELLGVARDLYSSTFDATAWLGAAAGYLIITLPLIRLVTILEKRLRSGLTSVVG